MDCPKLRQRRCRSWGLRERLRRLVFQQSAEVQGKHAKRHMSSYLWGGSMPDGVYLDSNDAFDILDVLLHHVLGSIQTRQFVCIERDRGGRHQDPEAVVASSPCPLGLAELQLDDKTLSTTDLSRSHVDLEAIGELCLAQIRGDLPEDAVT